MRHREFRVVSGCDQPPSSQKSDVSAGSAGSSVVDVPIRCLVPDDCSAGANLLSGGICLPKGLLPNVTSAALVTNSDGEPAAQADILNCWTDGSVRWLLASSVCSPGAVDGAVLRLRSIALADVESNEGSAIALRRVGTRLVLRTTDASRQVFSELELSPELILDDGTTARLTPSAVRQESQGAIRSVYRIDCSLKSDARIALQLRLELWPTAGVVQVSVRLRNARRARHKGGLWDLGDPGSFHFSALRVSVSRRDARPMSVRWKAEHDSAVRELTDGRLDIVQYDSGESARSGSQHVADADGPADKRGYEVRSPAGINRGDRAAPVITSVFADGRFTIGVPEFREKCPTAVSVEDGTTTVHLFPAGSVGEAVSCSDSVRHEYQPPGASPRFDASAGIEPGASARRLIKNHSSVGESRELQGGEQCTQSFVMTTEFTDEDDGSIGRVPSNVRMLPSADWVESCDVIDWFSASDGDSAGQRYRRYVEEATTGAHSLEARRATIDEYGWRNFGDIPADHEQTHYTGTETVVSHYNNQYDQIFGGILNLLVAGDRRWWHLSDPLARHVMDIDIYHTTEDRAAFCGGLFWHTDHYLDARTATHRTYSALNAGDRNGYGGGPANEHNYTTGLLHYYFLTGNPEASESVLTLADWVITMDDGSRTVFGLFDDGPTGLASSTVSEDYHGPGRGAGNSINALLDAWILTSEERYLAKAEELIQRVVHPRQDLDALHLLDSETHWSYTVCLTALGRYLGEMNRADRRGACYSYVRATLCHYGRWMADHERPTLNDPDDLEFVTVAWAAQDFRKANVLRIAAICCDDERDAERMRQRADELNDAAWRDFHKFDDTHLTARCLAIQMTEGLRDVYHRNSGRRRLPAADEDWKESHDAITEWTMFVPQKERVKRQLKSPGSAIRAIVRALSPLRWIRTADALKRRM